jgi:hypothetical protein
MKLMARRSSSGLTVEMCPFIDSRLWQREGRLRAGECFTYSWTYGGEPAGGISVRIENNEAVLRFQVCPGQGVEAALQEQHVPIAWTACHFGGSRPWFLCSAMVDGKYCGRRVAKLYLGGSPVFACRQCHDLIFVSQLEPVGLRGIEKARKIRMKLGGGPDMFAQFPPRPKNMHSSTYDRLHRIHEATLARLQIRVDSTVRHLDILDGDPPEWAQSENARPR